MALHEHDRNGPSAAGAAAAAVAAEAAEQRQRDRVAQQTADLVRRAQSALVRADIAGYGHALAETASIPDHSRRYQARLRSIELGLVERGNLSAIQLSRQFLVSLHALATWLEDEPREPMLMALAGILAIELGTYREAEALLEGALKMRDDLPDLPKSIKVARERRKSRSTVPGLPVDVRQKLPALRKRLAAVAAQAGPAEGLTLSVCMIVRDEEEMLPRCLEAVKDGVDEIIVVDTGSRDRTVEIAESFGAKVIHFPWTGDFAEARNVGIDAATGDWIFKLDADEIFVGDDALGLRALTGQTWREAFYFEMTNQLGDEDEGVAAVHQALVMFRNRPGRRYRGIVHEQMAWDLPGYLPERLAYTELRLDHYGYLSTVRTEKGKTNRNLELLLGQLEAGEENSFLHFNLGSEYMGIDDEKSLHHLKEAWRLAVDDPRMTEYGFVPSMCSRYVHVLRVAKDYEAFDDAAALIHERFEGFTDITYEQSIAAYQRDDLAGARAFAERCLEMGDAPAKYSSTVGCGSYLAQMRLAQLDIVEGKEDDAVARMRRVRIEFPTYFGLIDPLVAALLMRGESPDDVLAELTDGVDLSPSGWFILAVNLQERGHLEQAEAAFRGALERRPTFDAVRVALADALLVQGRILEAAEEAEAVPADDPRVGGPALRTALFARLALDDGDAPDLAARRSALVEQLAAADIAEAEKVVLRAWADQRAGVTTPPPSLGREAIDRMTPLLDALLRLGAADAFADLARLLPATGIDRRTQHEVMAMLLLRRGLTDLAGEEWISAVQEDGPDADAYAGLAEVARVQGMAEDARTLAAEALSMDPRHAFATRVLEAVAA